MRGMIWLSERPVFQPWVLSCVRRLAAFARSCSRRCGSCWTMSRAARAAALGGGGGGGGVWGWGVGGGEDVSAGAIGEPIDEGFRAANETAGAADSLA